MCAYGKSIRVVTRYCRARTFNAIGKFGNFPIVVIDPDQAELVACPGQLVLIGVL